MVFSVQTSRLICSGGDCFTKNIEGNQTAGICCRLPMCWADTRRKRAVAATGTQTTTPKTYVPRIVVVRTQPFLCNSQAERKLQNAVRFTTRVRLHHIPCPACCSGTLGGTSSPPCCRQSRPRTRSSRCLPAADTHTHARTRKKHTPGYPAALAIANSQAQKGTYVQAETARLKSAHSAVTS